MEYRSTNDNGWVHFQGDLVSNVSSGQAVNSSHGIRLTGGSTGGIVESAGDETNIALRIGGKGTGSAKCGNSSSPTELGNSTSAWAAVIRYVVQFTPSALSSGPAFVESTITVTGLSTTSLLLFTPRTNMTGAYSYMVRCSTAAELKFSESCQSASTIGSGESTSRGFLTEFRWA